MNKQNSANPIIGDELEGPAAGRNTSLTLRRPGCGISGVLSYFLSSAVFFGFSFGLLFFPGLPEQQKPFRSHRFSFVFKASRYNLRWSSNTSPTELQFLHVDFLSVFFEEGFNRSPWRQKTAYSSSNPPDKVCCLDKPAKTISAPKPRSQTHCGVLCLLFGITTVDGQPKCGHFNIKSVNNSVVCELFSRSNSTNALLSPGCTLYQSELSQTIPPAVATTATTAALTTIATGASASTAKIATTHKTTTIKTTIQAPVTECVGHNQLTVLPVSLCILPFTYNGQIYYNCTKEVNINSTCGPNYFYTCLDSSRRLCICSDPENFNNTNHTANVEIPLEVTPYLGYFIYDWLVIMQRENRLYDFFRNWDTYRNGFGDFPNNFYMGNEKVQQLTYQAHQQGIPYKLRMEYFACGKWWADEWQSFYLSSESDLKVFDSIESEMMFAILRHYGIPVEIVNAIKVMYDQPKSQELIEGEMSEAFAITTDVLQYDVPAPFQFIIKSRQQMRHPNKKLTISHTWKAKPEGHNSSHPLSNRVPKRYRLYVENYQGDTGHDIMAYMSGSHYVNFYQHNTYFSVSGRDSSTYANCSDGLRFDVYREDDDSFHPIQTMRMMIRQFW
ncbi:hypothetical protein HELRODRAFT_182854 [Helobdella robusta]|uniref:Uncharacterized protein n=1 Tax=Helobdella robusta TaxID=6412 RepID=T1FIV3_HELRO|nr:hypothetical protein HELRODRAFT_182854 [Helobdella robusta]ESN90062.1 hypothetical protein HELRODRAFT_182854 [Helobdella robusta]